MDCYTDWPDIIPMRHNTTTSQITTALQQGFCRTAIPDIIWSDGGPQFTSTKFNQFSQQWGFRHKISSPYHPQSNRKIDSTVKSMKKIIYTVWSGHFLDHDKFCCALLQYRNTPSRKDELYLRLRSFMGALPRIPFLPTVAHSLKSGNVK